jgi:3-oxoacyl-[acyl-carrier protein] reductase
MSTGRKIFVSGCSRGLGFALVEHFLMAGDTVIGCSRSECPVRSDRFQHFQVDVTHEEAVTSMFRQIKREHGYLDVLLNNAGTAAMSPFALQPASVVKKVFDLNVGAVLGVTSAALRLLRSAAHPRIVNLSSVAVPYRLEGEAVYSASKAAIEQWSRVLAHELGEMRITVNTVGPSPIRTDLLRGLSEESLSRLIDRQAIPRWATHVDLINVVEFFLRPESDMITGQVIYLGEAG